MSEFEDINGYDFSNLPPHVLVNILLRLKLPDFKNAVQTCNSWYYASCDPQITRHILVSGLKDSAQLEYVRRPIHNIILNNVNMNKFNFRKLFANFGETIIDLEILMSTLAFTRIFEIFAYLPNVRTLKIYLVSNYFSSQNFYKCKALQKNHDTIAKNLKQIKYLTVHVRMRDLQGMKLFLSHCTNVEKLHWNESIYLPNNQIQFICNFLLEPLENPAITKVTDLLIGCIHRDDNRQFFTKLINVSLPYLRRLHIKEISKSIYDVTFREFCKTYHYLENLTINCCNEQHLHDICKFMHNLKTLRLEKCNAHNLVDIGQLSLLEYLHLDRVDIIRDDKLTKLLSLNLCNLTKLTINFVDENILTLICENCRNLEELHLKHVDTKNCEPIFRNLLKLRVLKLGFNKPAPCNSSQMDILSDCNITRLTKLEEVFVSCWLPGLIPDLVRKLPNLQRSSLEDTCDQTDEKRVDQAVAMELIESRIAYMQLAPEIQAPEFELTDFDSSLYNSIL